MTSSSAMTLVNKTLRIYSDFNEQCEVGEVSWIQFPISRQVFERGSQIVDGIYMQVRPFEVSFPIPKILLQEFASWDAASDEALLNFEGEIINNAAG